jgi:protein gp37
MGIETGIAWTDHTWSPWIGCTKVSDGCKFCYADTLNHRWGHDNWGVGKPRRVTANWRQPVTWDKQARAAGVRRKIFPSMCDPFDLEVPSQVFADFMNLVEATPNLDWLLLTKRIGAVRTRLLEIGRESLPGNVWLGASAENQTWLEQRAPVLLSFDVKVRFLSLEPLLGPLDVTPYIIPHFAADDPRHAPWRNGVEWLIIGGESGHGARPMALEWADKIINDVTMRSSAAVFMKQTGVVLAQELGLKHKKGEDLEEWPWRLQIQEFPR